MRDVFFLVADGGMAEVVKGFLGREPHRRLGCGPFGVDPAQDIRVAPTKDPGIYNTAHGLLQPFRQTHRRAVIIVDAAWEGSPGADTIRKRVTQNVALTWDEFTVIVIEPELEAWLMNENQHLVDVLRCPKEYRAILRRAGFWPEGEPKPFQPKEALDHLRRKHRVRAFNADFGKLARAMSVKQCQDPAFNQLRDQLRAWFPPEQP